MKKIVEVEGVRKGIYNKLQLGSLLGEDRLDALFLIDKINILIIRPGQTLQPNELTNYEGFKFDKRIELNWHFIAALITDRLNKPKI